LLLFVHKKKILSVSQPFDFTYYLSGRTLNDLPGGGCRLLSTPNRSAAVRAVAPAKKIRPVDLAVFLLTDNHLHACCHPRSNSDLGQPQSFLLLFFKKMLLPSLQHIDFACYPSEWSRSIPMKKSSWFFFQKEHLLAFG